MRRTQIIHTSWTTAMFQLGGGLVATGTCGDPMRGAAGESEGYSRGSAGLSHVFTSRSYVAGAESSTQPVTAVCCGGF